MIPCRPCRTRRSSSEPLLGASVGFLAAVVPGRVAARRQAAPAAARRRREVQGTQRQDLLRPGRGGAPAEGGHLSACGESDATFLGEEGSKETCKYVFKVEGQKEDDTFVQVYAPAQKEVPSEPNDPFFRGRRSARSS